MLPQIYNFFCTYDTDNADFLYFAAKLTEYDGLARGAVLKLSIVYIV